MYRYFCKPETDLLSNLSCLLSVSMITSESPLIGSKISGFIKSFFMNRQNSNSAIDKFSVCHNVPKVHLQTLSAGFHRKKVEHGLPFPEFKPLNQPVSKESNISISSDSVFQARQILCQLEVKKFNI